MVVGPAGDIVAMSQVKAHSQDGSYADKEDTFLSPNYPRLVDAGKDDLVQGEASEQDAQPHVEEVGIMKQAFKSVVVHVS